MSLGPRDSALTARGAVLCGRGAAAALVAFEAWGIATGHASASPAALAIALALAAVVLGLIEVARRFERWSFAWILVGLCGPLALLLLALEAPEPGVSGQIGLLYSVVFCSLFLRPGGAWLVAGTTVLADLAINLSMFDLEPAVFNTASVAMIVVTVTMLMTMAVRQQEENAERLQAQASVDPLTSLATRRELERVAQAVLRPMVPRLRDRHRDDGVALLIVDLDRFKDLNDAYGHPAGDQALVHVAALVRRCAGSAATVARLGGDELAVLLAGRTRDSAALVAQCIVDCVASLPVDHAGRSIRLSASVGVCHAPASAGTELTDLYAGADAALYRAKVEGRSRIALA